MTWYHPALAQRTINELDSEIELLRAVANAARAFEAHLSECCDGPERDMLRAALKRI